MSYAIKIGTVSAQWIDQENTPDGCVRFDGDFPVNPVWDDKLQNIREMTESELGESIKSDDKEAAMKSLEAAILRKMAESFVSGKVASDPVMAEVAVKVSAEVEAVNAFPGKIEGMALEALLGEK